MIIIKIVIIIIIIIIIVTIIIIPTKKYWQGLKKIFPRDVVKFQKNKGDGEIQKKISKRLSKLKKFATRKRQEN